jgi:hypothetical protein
VKPIRPSSTSIWVSDFLWLKGTTLKQSTPAQIPFFYPNSSKPAWDDIGTIQISLAEEDSASVLNNRQRTKGQPKLAAG